MRILWTASVVAVALVSTSCSDRNEQPPTRKSKEELAQETVARHTSGWKNAEDRQAGPPTDELIDKIRAERERIEKRDAPARPDAFPSAADGGTETARESSPVPVGTRHPKVSDARQPRVPDDLPPSAKLVAGPEVIKEPSVLIQRALYLETQGRLDEALSFLRFASRKVRDDYGLAWAIREAMVRVNTKLGYKVGLPPPTRRPRMGDTKVRMPPQSGNPRSVVMPGEDTLIERAAGRGLNLSDYIERRQAVARYAKMIERVRAVTVGTTRQRVEELLGAAVEPHAELAADETAYRVAFEDTADADRAALVVAIPFDDTNGRGSSSNRALKWPRVLLESVEPEWNEFLMELNVLGQDE